MHKSKLKDVATEILNDLNLDNVESIGIESDEYSGGEPYVEIRIDYKGNKDAI